MLPVHELWVYFWLQLNLASLPGKTVRFARAVFVFGVRLFRMEYFGEMEWF